MQLTNNNMIANQVKTAKSKLEQHRNLGEKSSLSIFQVAQLMDTVKFGVQEASYQQYSVFFSLN